ncbi:hypothetical protein K474DRAFT_1699472 [Panus rudis PR-1116 ss-1]|nr:hypothetical protein K474DRAFT_1699472 [Panus rudis PR-1116 ss-1]
MCYLNTSLRPHRARAKSVNATFNRLGTPYRAITTYDTLANIIAEAGDVAGRVGVLGSMLMVLRIEGRYFTQGDRAPKAIPLEHGPLAGPSLGKPLQPRRSLGGPIDQVEEGLVYTRKTQETYPLSSLVHRQPEVSHPAPRGLMMRASEIRLGGIGAPMIGWGSTSRVPRRVEVKPRERDRERLSSSRTTPSNLHSLYGYPDSDLTAQPATSVGWRWTRSTPPTGAPFNPPPSSLPLLRLPPSHLYISPIPLPSPFNLTSSPTPPAPPPYSSNYSPYCSRSSPYSSSSSTRVSNSLSHPTH